MQGIWISSDICTYTHKSFHGSPMCRSLGQGSSQILGVGAQVRDVKPSSWCSQMRYVSSFSPLCILDRKKNKFKTHYSTIFFSSYFYLLLFSQQGNVNKDLWLTARWQPRCCVYCQETHRVFDKGSWIISSILESVIFLLLPLRDVPALSTSLLVGIPDGLISVILIGGQTSFCFVAICTEPLCLEARGRRGRWGLWKCVFLGFHGKSWRALGHTEFAGVLGSGVRKVRALPSVLQSLWGYIFL